MAINVTIISRQKIRPSLPATESHRKLKLSFLDQMAPNLYIPLVLFYPPSVTTTTHDLKTSLSKTLSYMYPLAGKLKDGFTMECNDEGAVFVETKVSQEMSAVLESLKFNVLLQLLPFDPIPRSSNPSPDQVALGVQVNKFACGGTAIGVCIWHLMADGSTSGTFLKTWSDVCRGNAIHDNIRSSFVLDAASIFPSSTIRGFPLPTWLCVDGSPMILWNTEELSCKSAMRRFVFDGGKIAQLRDMLTAEGTGRPSRVEALSVFLWSKFIAATKETKKEVKLNLFTNAINLRRRLDPPLPDNAIGNFYHENGAQWRSEEGDLRYSTLLQRVRKSIRTVNGEYMRRVQSAVAQVNVCINNGTQAPFERHEMACLTTTSWCRFNYYQVDFGWGKPIWVANAFLSLNLAVLMDTEDGNGIEVWMALSEKDMHIIEMDSEFLAYVSSSHTL